MVNLDQFPSVTCASAINYIPTYTYRYGQGLFLDELFNAASVQFGNSFLVVGGYRYDPSDWVTDHLNGIMIYNPETEAMESYDSLSSGGRSEFGATLVTEELVLCA